MITRYKDIIVPWLFVKNHPELEIDLNNFIGSTIFIKSLKEIHS